MANTRQVLTDRFFVVSGAGKKQSAMGTGLANSDLDTRDKCTVTREEVVDRRVYMDCRNEDPMSSKVITRLARYTLDYAEVTPQIIARWTAYKEGASTAPTGSSANETQTLTYSGTVSGGTFTLALTLEGRTVTTKPIAYNATPATVEKALTAARMKFIEPGDVTATGGVKQKETLAVSGTANADDDLVVTVKATNSTALASGKAINVTIANGDTNAQVATKIKAALDLDADVAAFFTLTVNSADVVFEAKAAAANDADMEISYPTAFGMTAATSTNTTAGVAATVWGSNPLTLTFDERLGNANLPLLTVDNTNITGGGTIVAAQTSAGDQNHHAAITRSTSRAKPFVSFAVGWDADTDRVEKYIDYVVDSVTGNGELDGDVSLSVTLIGPWEYDSIEETFDIPDCENIDPLQTKDCRLQIDGTWQTTDISSFNAAINDNVPTDRLSAFGFDGVDVENLERGRQPSNSFSASIFGSETDGLYDLAQNERTEDPAAVNIHFGMPGNRCSWHFPKTQIQFQTNRQGFVGDAQYSTIQIEGQPLKDSTNPPFNADAYLDQSTAFLV